MKRWLALGAMVAIGGGVYGMEGETSEKMILVSRHLVERKDSIPSLPKKCPSLKRTALNVCAFYLNSLDNKEDFLKKLPKELKEPLRAKMIRKKGDVWQQWWDLSAEDREKEENISLWKQAGKKEFLDIYDILDVNKKENWSKVGVCFSPLKPAVEIWLDYLKEKDNFQQKENITNLTEEDLLNSPLKDYLDRRLKEKEYSLRKFLKKLRIPPTLCLPDEEPGLPNEKPGLPAEGLNIKGLFEILSVYLGDSTVSCLERLSKTFGLSWQQQATIQRQVENLRKKLIGPLLKLLKPVQALSISSTYKRDNSVDYYLRNQLIDNSIEEIVSVLPLKKLKLKGVFWFFSLLGEKLITTPISFEFLITQMMKNPSLNLKELSLEEVFIDASSDPRQCPGMINHLHEAVFQNLEKLSLNRNELEDKDINLFMEALEDKNFLPQLKVLDLSGKNITVKSINPLVKCLSKRSCFQKLILRGYSFNFKENILVLLILKKTS